VAATFAATVMSRVEENWKKIFATFCETVGDVVARLVPKISPNISLRLSFQHMC
jgi:hypothetical protein